LEKISDNNLLNIVKCLQIIKNMLL